MGKIILASSSPRRAHILDILKLDYEIIPSSYAEPHNKTDFSYDFVETLAYNKALDVAKKLKTDGIVLGADTIVVIDNKILGKPESFEQAKQMLELLSGKTHIVVTAIALIDPQTMKHDVKSTTTRVTFNQLSEEQIVSYIKGFKPFDKAGSYGLQELPDGFVKTIDGSVDNVIGLPSETLLKMLENLS